MVVFFLGMCREAGIPTLETPRQRTSGVAPGERRQAELGAFQGPRPWLLPLVQLSPTSQLRARPVYILRWRCSYGVCLQPGKAMSTEKRHQWIEMASAALAFIYPDEEF